MRERSDRSGGAERRRIVCVHRRQLSGCWGGVRAVAVWGGCVRTQGANRAVLGRFGAVRGGSGCQQSGRLCAHTGSGSGCSGLFGAVRAVRAVCAHGQGASPLYGLSSALQALLRFGSFFLRSVRPVGTPASAAFDLGCGECAPCRHSGFGCI